LAGALEENKLIAPAFHYQVDEMTYIMNMIYKENELAIDKVKREENYRIFKNLNALICHL
tara:strand:- start:116 stop:295 length:180 start_codon:yes stop_codon:yes gene_type:complete